MPDVTDNRDEEEQGNESMTVREAGHLGGEKGGQRVRELIEEGKEREAKEQSQDFHETASSKSDDNGDNEQPDD